MKWIGLVVYFAVLTWSVIAPHDYFTWVLEAAPALIALVVLAMTYRWFPLTSLAFRLILIHCAILFTGVHYTYAEVKTKSEFQALQVNLWRQTAPAVFAHDQARVSYSPTIFSVSPGLTGKLIVLLSQSFRLCEITAHVCA
jgi:uncharacterized membrane protein YjdF